MTKMGILRKFCFPISGGVVPDWRIFNVPHETQGFVLTLSMSNDGDITEDAKVVRLVSSDRTGVMHRTFADVTSCS